MDTILSIEKKEKKMPITNLSSLQSSPVFKMSLSAKELFHSNFLAWAIEQYPLQAKDFFCGVLKLEEDDYCKCECQENSSCITKIEREDKNIDLSFIICNCCSIYIENKFKSIAYAEQLDKYSEKLSKNDGCQKFILLSLKTPKFFKGNTYNNWTLVTYKQLLHGFYNKIVNDTNIECDYKKYLIQDYINFVQKLIDEILPIFTDFENDKLSISNLHLSKPQPTRENEILTECQDVRLHDLFQKGIFEDFAYRLYDASKLNFTSIPSQDIIYGKDTQEKGHIGIYFSYTNNQGLAGIQYSPIDGCSLGVQIQGNEYRQYVIGDDKKMENLANCLLSTNKWFYDFTNNTQFQEPSGKTNITTPTKFKSYKIKNNQLFIYRSKSLINGKKNIDLMTQIITDMHKAISIQNCQCTQ
jgi:hypothetical protein